MTDPASPNTNANASSNASSALTPANPATASASPSPRRIAHQHHGQLTCDPTPTGASFTLCIPTEV